MIIPDLDWQRPGLLTRGQTKAKYGHWAVPGWAPAPDGGMYWILPYDMSTYDPWHYDPSRFTWQAWVLYTDGRLGPACPRDRRQEQRERLQQGDRPQECVVRRQG